jgi:hypothetical protein
MAMFGSPSLETLRARGFSIVVDTGPPWPSPPERVTLKSTSPERTSSEDREGLPARRGRCHHWGPAGRVSWCCVHLPKVCFGSEVAKPACPRSASALRRSSPKADGPLPAKPDNTEIPDWLYRVLC